MPTATHLGHTIVTRILKRKDDKHQQRTRNELGKELARLGIECLRIRAEDARRGPRRRRHGPHAVTALEPVDRTDVVCVHDARPHEAA